MKVLTRVFTYSEKFGSQAKLSQNGKTTLFKPEDRRFLCGIYSFLPKERVFISEDGNFEIFSVEVIKPTAPVGTVLEVTFRKDADGWVGSASHGGRLIRVFPTNPITFLTHGPSEKYAVRVDCISSSDDLVVYGKVKEVLKTRRGKVIERRQIFV